ncbi:alpha-1,3-rhamnosyl/mannosyltransferase [Desulfobotulus alkaliphilus]|uniref:Alpha-1,3-rhamnosyl/mannosyltransferase n=1 Tax=Desulfobotulus alkaliphilus TaxID=622671 RepID=A0A562RAI3_9BACT|nr:glycosyltransferase family 1 protein [Desulfobotulus alkaliphilus]TWI66068.1 alpha-1,3-rhamnosyl/mannosyltransferase [Desulfobotulus alkaliphilus]
MNGAVLGQDDFYEYLKTLEKGFPEHSENRPFILSQKEKIKGYIRDIPGLYTPYKNWQNLRTGKCLARLRADIYHEPSFISVPFKGNSILTIHDLSHIRYPETHPAARVRWLNKKLSQCIAKASAVLTISECIRKELLLSGLVSKESLVHVTPLGYDTGFCPRSEGETKECLENLGLSWRQFILSVATLEPRKNLDRLLEAYLSLPEKTVKELPLVLAGAHGWKNRGLIQKTEQVKKPWRVIVTGYLSAPEIKNLMASAAVFAYPSLYEGFGLPVLEAMASGTPVLTSNRGALAELAENAALLVTPEDTYAIAEGLETLLSSEKIRTELHGKGLERASCFSWKQCARTTLAVYEKTHICT